MSLRALYDLAAPAKINLFLHVVGRRADGYHLLESVFVLIDWADTLHVECRNDGQLVRHDLGPALPADDLCLRAARALQQASATALGADISILKRVPWGAGMGGGSSDAATTLLALNHLWGLHWPRQQLTRIGLTLGADVPFFLLGRHALVQGIGERLTPMSLQPMQLAVVKPPATIPTRDIFKHPLLKRDAQTVIVSGFPEGAEQEQVGWPLSWGAEGSVQAMSFGRNDLQPAAVDRCPEVAQVARWLQARYGNSRMTGSGSAVFARVGFAGMAGVGASPLATFPADELPPDWVGRLCHSLVEHPLRGWAG